MATHCVCMQLTCHPVMFLPLADSLCSSDLAGLVQEGISVSFSFVASVPVSIITTCAVLCGELRMVCSN